MALALKIETAATAAFDSKTQNQKRRVRPAVDSSKGFPRQPPATKQEHPKKALQEVSQRIFR